MADTIQENIDNSYLFGCVKYKENYTFYLMPIAYWILNHIAYDPTYNPDDWKDGFIFRDNILNVEDDNIELFIQAIEVDKIDIDTVNVKEYGLGNIFLFLIDFDSKTFISYFDDISIEEYLPNESWIGKFDDPIKYMPKEFVDKISNS